MDDEEAIMGYIRECDSRYEREYILLDRDSPDSNVCRRMLDLGYDLDLGSLKRVCERFCARWEARDFKGTSRV
jgi:hypothetical protein